MLIGAHTKAYYIARLHRFRRFGALAVDFDLTSGDRFGRRRARFEEPRGPEPLVEANPIGVVGYDQRWLS